MRYICMSFGGFQPHFDESHVADLSAAEAEIVAMLERGAMIVHAYRETDQEHPELVGRHRMLCSSCFESAERGTQAAEAAHQIERFLIDPENFQVWADALNRNAPIEQCWAVVELWPPAQEETDCFYGRATLIESA